MHEQRAMGLIAFEQHTGSAPAACLKCTPHAVVQWNASCPVHKRPCKCSYRRQSRSRALNERPSRMPTSRVLTPEDQIAFSYFHHFAAVDLSGYLPGRFWDQLVLQVGESEPVVQQTLVAVGNAHFDHCARNDASPNTLATHQSALIKLRQYMEGGTTPSHEVVIVCCILLFAFSRMAQIQGAAIVHLRSAMSILRNARKGAGEGCGGHATIGRDALHAISVMLIQLDIEATMQDIDRGTQLDLSRDIVGETFTESNWNPDMRFFSPHDAMEPWMAVCHDMWRFISGHAQYRFVPFICVPADVVMARRSIQDRIRDWRRATKGYIHNSPVIYSLELGHISTKAYNAREIVDVINALVIEAHYFSCKRFIAESLQDPSTPKPFDWKPEKLLTTASRVIALRKVHRAMTDVQPSATFSTHVGIAETLLLLTHRTSFPNVRHQAQALVQQFKEAQGGLSGLGAFFAGYGAPPSDFILIYERPGH